jgi:hypothetical protein
MAALGAGAVVSVIGLDPSMFPVQAGRRSGDRKRTRIQAAIAKARPATAAPKANDKRPRAARGSSLPHGLGNRLGAGLAREPLQHAQALFREAADAGGRREFAGDPAAHHRVGGRSDIVLGWMQRATTSLEFGEADFPDLRAE